MSKDKKIECTEENWDSRALGADENFVEAVKQLDEEAIDKSIDLQMISIRIQKSLLEDIKIIANLDGIGYQPLIKQVLKRFADSEKKRILREMAVLRRMQDAEQGDCDKEEDCGPSVKTA